jgi:hypothetical protein
VGERSPILIIPVIFGIIGGIMMIVGDFGGWYNYNAYIGYREWVYINAFSYAAVLILPMAFLLFLSSIFALMAFRSPPPVARKLVMRGLVAALIVLIITVIGAVALLAATMDASENWLDVGFYGGFFGSLLTAIVLGFESRRMGQALGPPVPPAYAPGPVPVYAPQPQQPYQQAPPQPAPRPQPPQPAPPPQPPAQPVCRNCGTPLQPGTKFCVACGAPQ